MAYENKSNWTLSQNKPNSKPIKANSRKAQMIVNSLITKDYRKKDDFAVRKNKPNSNPISERPKINVKLVATKDYENITTLKPKKNKPKQTQSQNPIYPQRAKIKHAVATAQAARLLPWLDHVVRLRVSGSLTTNTVDIILRPDENVLLGNSRTGAALLVEFILGKDLKFASRLDNCGLAFLGEEIYPALSPDRRGRISPTQTLSPENFAGFRPETLGDTGLGDQEKERADIKH